MNRVSLLQIGQRVKGDKKCANNDTKKVVCLFWHTTEDVNLVLLVIFIFSYIP